MEREKIIFEGCVDVENKPCGDALAWKMTYMGKRVSEEVWNSVPVSELANIWHERLTIAEVERHFNVKIQ